MNVQMNVGILDVGTAATPLVGWRNKAATPSWYTVTVSPPTVSVPVRDVCPVCDSTVYVTLPLPVPLEPEIIEIHAALLVAVQLQLPDVVTLAVPLPLPVPPV